MSSTPKSNTAKTASALRAHTPVVLGLAAVLLFAALLQLQRAERVVINGTPIRVEVADDRQEREQGLSGRDALGEEEGMLFVFDQSGRPGIWMKDMSFALDIVWLDDSKTIVDIAENVEPSSYPETFTSNSDARYVLEVPAGTVRKLNWQVGQQAAFYL